MMNDQYPLNEFTLKYSENLNQIEVMYPVASSS